MMRAWVDFVKFKRNSPFYIHPEEASSGAEALGSAVPGPMLRGCCCVATSSVCDQAHAADHSMYTRRSGVCQTDQACMLGWQEPQSCIVSTSSESLSGWPLHQLTMHPLLAGDLLRACCSPCCCPLYQCSCSVQCLAGHAACKLHCVGAGGQEAWEGGVHTAMSRRYVLAQYMRLEPKYVPEELCTPAELRCVLTAAGDT